MLGRVALVMVVALPAISFALATGRASAQENRIPNGRLEVAYRQLSDGKRSTAVFQNVLDCAGGHCSLSTLTIGQCVVGAWYPKIERWSTRDGNLRLTPIVPDALAAEFNADGAVFRLRFDYQQIGGMFRRITGFSGGVVKQSEVLSRVTTWELVPVAIMESTFTPGCPVQVAGLQK